MEKVVFKPTKVYHLIFINIFSKKNKKIYLCKVVYGLLDIFNNKGKKNPINPLLKPK